MTDTPTPSETTSQARTLDVRPVPPKERFDKIMHAYRTLPPGHVLQLVVDHDPKCMYYTLLNDHGADAFDFDYRERGPETWRVHVTRTPPA